MRREHGAAPACDAAFASPECGGLAATPAGEWRLAVRGDPAGADMRRGRAVPDLPALAASPLARRAGLAAWEVAAVVLHTGPMVRGRRRLTGV
jgi:hypothetical protein